MARHNRKKLVFTMRYAPYGQYAPSGYDEWLLMPDGKMLLCSGVAHTGRLDHVIAWLVWNGYSVVERACGLSAVKAKSDDRPRDWAFK